MNKKGGKIRLVLKGKNFMDFFAVGKEREARYRSVFDKKTLRYLVLGK